MKEKNKVTTRFPRPKGLTYLAYLQNKESHEKTQMTQYNPVIKFIVNKYVMNNFTINGEYRSIEEMANWLNLTHYHVLRMTNEVYREMNDFVGEGLGNEQMARAIEQMVTNLALETRALSQNQVNMLLAQQKGQYQPFLTAEANKAIANSINSLKPFIELLKVYKGQPTNNFNGPTQINSGKAIDSDESALTATKAIEALKANGHKSLIEDIDYLETIKAEMDKIAALPEVDARLQGQISSNADDPALLSLNGNKAKKQESRQGRLESQRGSGEIAEIINPDEFIG